jgi:hypothetical protein
MRKRIIAPVQQETAPPDQDWLNVEGLAEVEITSEDVAHPIESALLPGRASGWRAAEPGKQAIRLLFVHPQRLRRIWLNFEEPLTERTQRVRPALVAGWRAVVPGYRAAAVELQPPRRNFRDGRPSRRALGGHRARVEHHPGHKWGGCFRFFGAVAACLTPWTPPATRRARTQVRLLASSPIRWSSYEA